MVKDGIFLGERYEVLSKIGSGGMADVYKGRDCMLNRYVAIKVLKKEYREDRGFVQKFRAEAQAAAGLMHPNIVNVYDVGEDRGLYYMVMELVEGITLKDYIRKKGRLSVKEVISISIQMCSGIEAAHRHHIIHRDIKPQNVIISKEGKVKVTDFGIARASTSNTISSNAMGSVHYVSPEQARGGFCDAKSDIYSVGITMYEMITGSVPFDGNSAVSVAMKHLQENITPPSELTPDISGALEKIILKCVQKSPDRRYQDISMLIADLKRALMDPEGGFVDIKPIRSIGDTVMISSEEMSRLKRSGGRYRDEDEYEDGYEDGYEEEEDEGYDDYDAEGGDEDDDVNPRMNKMMKVLTIVVAVILVFVVLFIVGRAAGVFRFTNSHTAEETEKETEKVEVPKLVGEEVAVAEEMCRKRNLEMKIVQQVHSDEKEGVILEQKTPAGEKVERHTVIEVVVSSGAEEIEVPDVKDMDENTARKRLIEKGFDTKKIKVEDAYDDNIEAGKAVKTNPAAGTKTTADTEITLYISKGAEKKTVPDLRGKTVDEAKNLLSGAGLADGGGSEQYSDSVESGRIISQSVNPGDRVKSGTSVSYVVSRGKQPVTIPTGLAGKSVSEVSGILQNYGLKVGDTISVDSDVQNGIVLYTDPVEGSSVEAGSTVHIYVSNGSLSQPEPSGPSGGDTGQEPGADANINAITTE